MSGKPEKIVFIKRKISFMEQAQANDPEVVEYQSMAYKAIGSYFKEFGKQYGSGLTRKETSILMPEITGYYPDLDKRDFTKSTNEFFRNINTKVPGEGVRLNISLEKPDKELSENNLPVNIRDYITYKHALSHPEVGNSYEEASMYDHIRFYIEDEEGVIAAASDLNTKEDNARLAYYNIIESPEKVDHMLTMLGVNPSEMQLSEKKLLLKDHASIDPKRSAAVNEERLDRFVKLSEDRDLETKYVIEEMIRVGVLERIGMRILIKETGDQIGRDIREAALWFRDKGHTRDVNVLTARFNEFARSKGTSKPVEQKFEEKTEKPKDESSGSTGESIKKDNDE